ncbi:Methyltransferase FkbM [Gossypium australe]|uniref:Methyltransferase FkbM n=1 Tax=Gossypium australe TaxID=47621 RepID=A0A5B6X6M2_9ROSI|nr:Methyltransferase FkbM [Gossypium australe]
MEPITRKLSLLRNILERALLFGVFVIVIRFTYIGTISCESCNLSDFCFVSLPHNLNPIILNTEASSIVISSPHSKSLRIETTLGQEVFALKKVGVEDLIGIFNKATKPLVIKGEGHQIPFDFIFSGGARLDKSAQPFDFASEIARTLKPEGFAVLHTKLKVFEIGGFNPSMP